METRVGALVNGPCQAQPLGHPHRGLLGLPRTTHVPDVVSQVTSISSVGQGTTVQIPDPHN